MKIPDGITRGDVLEALAEIDELGDDHVFGDSTKYILIHDGRSYPPKAAIGYAGWRINSGTILPNNFNGGDSPDSASPYLRNSSST